MTWFQARDLAKTTRRAIRPESEQKWHLYRFTRWLVDNRVDPLRETLATDFTAAKFLAKEWTDEAWEGGSYPPCATPGGATAFVPSTTGGLGAWTLTGACAGAGEGGFPVLTAGVAETPPSGLALYAYALPSILEGESSAYAPPLTETAPVEIRATDGEAGIDDVWQYTGYVFAHYNVTGAAASDTEIVGLWTLEGITAALDEANLKGVADFDPGTWDSSMARPFFGHTIASHGRANRYYLGTPAAVASEPYILGGVGFTAVPAVTVIRVMMAQRLADGTITNVVQTAYTLPPFSGEVRYWNEEQSFEATCGAGTHGAAVTRTVAEHTYSSSVSVAAANATALSVATAAANAALECDADFLNEEQTATCDAGTHGDPVTVAAGTFSSPTSVADANATALAAAEAALVCEPD